ncbi:hypothetical protein QOT17_019233 [Balamuthia mandrillaris]
MEWTWRRVDPEHSSKITPSHSAAAQKNFKPPPRRYHSCVTHKGQLWLFGGSKATETFNDLFSFDLQNQVWSLVLSHHDSVVGAEEGGASSSGEHTGAAEQQQSRPPPRFGHAAYVWGESMWVFGGVGADNKPLNDLWAFHFETVRWRHVCTAGAPCPSPRYHYSGAVSGNMLYLFGGSQNLSTHLDDLWQFNFTTETWKHIPTATAGPASSSSTEEEKTKDNGTEDKHKGKEEEASTGAQQPCARAGHIVFIYNEELYVYGGYCGKGGFTYLQDTYKLSLASLLLEEECKTPIAAEGASSSQQLQYWQQLSSCSPPECLPLTARPMNCAMLGRCVFVYGGYDAGSSRPVSNLYMYDVVMNRWQIIKLWLALEGESSIVAAAIGTKAMHPIPRYGHTITLHDGSFFVFGGSGSLFLNDLVEIFP